MFGQLLTSTPTPTPSGDTWIDAAKVLAWPAFALIAVLIVIVLFLTSRRIRDALDSVLARLKRVKAGAVEVELTEQSATKVSQATQDAFATWRQRINWEFDREVEVRGLREKRERLIAEFVGPTLGKIARGLPKGHRSTIHVPDVLFAQSLYQLLDYYPGKGGRGRAFSSRRGIVGIVWRLGKSKIDGQVPTDEDSLIKDWGMTREEAAAVGQGHQSFIAAIIRDDSGSPVGVFFMSAEDRDAFGPEATHDELLREIERGTRETGLSAALASMLENLRKRGPAIRVHEVG